MKSSRFKKGYRKNASKLHRAVGDYLKSSSLFKSYEIYQEYPVSRIYTNYGNNSEKFDWVIPTLKIVIEVHGQQHSHIVAFDGDLDKAIDNLSAQKFRDNNKKNAALLTHYKYIVINFNEIDQLCDTFLLQKIEEANLVLEEMLESDIIIYNSKVKKAKGTDNEYHQQVLEKARQYRKQKYQFLKEQRKKNEKF